MTFEFKSNTGKGALSNKSNMSSEVILLKSQGQVQPKNALQMAAG